MHANKSTVWTAAHCLHDPSTGQWNNSYAFAPGFSNGSAYGYWTADRVIVTSAWAEDGDVRTSDMGALVMKQDPSYGYLQDPVGADGYVFRSNDPENDNVASIGYPADGYGRADSFYSGGMYMRYCYGNTIDADDWNPLDQRLQMDCEMGHGSSGGPVVKNLTSSAQIVGVNSHRHADSAGNWVDNYMFSSEHGAQAVAVYNAI